VPGESEYRGSRWLRCTVVDNGAEPEDIACRVRFSGIDPTRGTLNVNAQLSVRRHLAGIAVALAVVASTLGGTAVGGSVAQATPLTDVGPTAGGYAGRWLAAQVTADGFVPDANGDPAPSATLATALALATAGVDQATFDRTVGWLTAHVDDVTTPASVGAVDPGQVGYLMIVAVAAGDDPLSFGGVDLVARLNATLGAFEPGLYGAADPTYDGVFRQGLALLGLAAAGAVVPSVASGWLISQQCGTADPTVRGAWMAHRAPAEACKPGNPVTFTGVDTNSSAMAAQALSALGLTPNFDPLAFFDAVQNTTGGWGYLGDTADDPDSDALVIQAIVAAGQSPTSAPWVEAAGDPVSSLLGFQLGCDAAPADQGAFTFPGTNGAPNALATPQAVWGATARSFPLTRTTFSPAPVPCQQPVGEASTPTTSLSGLSTEPVVAAGAAQAVATVPAFTG
jgi:hypothetical protein